MGTVCFLLPACSGGLALSVSVYSICFWCGFTAQSGANRTNDKEPRVEPMQHARWANIASLGLSPRSPVTGSRNCMLVQ
ncbi:hypothetical protein BDV27DRAFT_120329 [Aspergillus caelatus]|uniref:Uncharacterized protein n=2 Tax=Aspergillus subgen. Circumdati TaxID=2720871 RepID=A0A5N7AIH5_9EURO|nr:uncharacterized protein BDV27DRAFT_120329 [Aspergillus caelatus]KAB8271612.1 hypothetical protein BDV30DRAFT_213273 [Aspergillus minisclerotigenes]KAE8369672.1 hypothetical protein BDV27DRAFT_120329 [Aspergillus caelatus]